MEQVAEGLTFRRIFWVNGPTRGGVAMGQAPKGGHRREPDRRAIYSIQDPPCNGWSSAFVIEGEKRSTIFCPHLMTAYQVPNKCAELVGSREAEWRPERMVKMIHDNWAESQKLGFMKDYDVAAVVLKRLGAEVPHLDLRSDGEEPRERGGKAVSEALKKPVKRTGKRGDFLSWFLEGDGHARPVREAMAHFGMSRSNVLSYLFILQKDHGIGYTLQGDLATVHLPDGVTDPFSEAQRAPEPEPEGKATPEPDEEVEEEDWLR